MKTNLQTKLKDIHDPLKMFIEQVKADGMWDNVVIVVASEFARTITPNNNAGSDHGTSNEKQSYYVAAVSKDFVGSNPMCGLLLVLF
jgi:hypothetical protein